MDERARTLSRKLHNTRQWESRVNSARVKLLAENKRLNQAHKAEIEVELKKLKSLHDRREQSGQRDSRQCEKKLKSSEQHQIQSEDTLHADWMQSENAMRTEMVTVLETKNSELQDAQQVIVGLEKEQERTHSHISQLAAKNYNLKQCNTTLSRRISCIPAQKATAADKAIKEVLKVGQDSSVGHAIELKECGMIPDETHALVWDLIGNGVPAHQVQATITAIVSATGSNVNGSLSKHSIGRIMLEGYVASKMQVVEEVSEAEGITISGDGTTHKHINYESHHVYLNSGDKHTRRTLGVHSAPNHTTCTADLYDTYNASPRGQHNPAKVQEFAAKITGVNTDHAEDQKKFTRLVCEKWKKQCAEELRGERALALMTQEELIPVLWEESTWTIKAAGGMEKWDQLSEDEQDQQHRGTLAAVITRLGRTAYDSLSADEKHHADLIIWGGCCMHKELNSIKGGNTKMTSFWSKARLTGPLLLMNWDNDAAAAIGGTAVRSMAEEVSEGGGVKTTKLAGAIFRHKDDKKGQQDTYQIFFEASSAIGAIVDFPDTSNTRYQSHCTAAELITHLPLYIEFLDAIQDKKDSHALNHLEANLYWALHDTPTITELCVLALYSQVICHPYLHQVRSPYQEHSNLLELGPLHDSLLLAPNAFYHQGALDRNLWERPELFYAVHRLQESLPHLEPAMVAFFEGALTTWECFSSKFAKGGRIDTSTIAEKQRAWMRTTNDDNEGALGAYRVGAQHTPSMTLHQYNACMIFKSNATAAYVEGILDPNNHLFLRQEARRIDASGQERQRQSEQAQEDARTMTWRRELNKAAETKKEAWRTRLAALEVVMNPAQLTTKMNVAQINAQIEWHHQRIYGSKSRNWKLSKEHYITISESQSLSAIGLADVSQGMGLTQVPRVR
ncbi:hypothetical protein WOLCODRAFT_90336 [Wolfiporia cocos MD-104 SS10]|uniref:Uncharacterized protein n=1 Tax=Wolfiporia cocos (strain MD-104) TaxID=742152 RepID=A0A2H3JMX2_WOLCO|nr:hypothetical protein WOLCODRAFT_90336 [Wolfiporia cocos MD-104 SS10]